MVRSVSVQVRQQELQRPLTLYCNDTYTRAIRMEESNVDLCITTNKLTCERISDDNDENIHDNKHQQPSSCTFCKFVQQLFIKHLRDQCCGWRKK